jgi:hypothetical protein
MKTLLRFVTIAFAVGVLAPHASAADRRLPEFDVTSADADVVSSTALGDAGNWLLIYIRPACTPCDALVNLWSGGEPPAAVSRVRVIVGAATTDTLRQLQGQYPMLEGAAWYADSTGAAAHALGLGGAPAIYGMRDRSIAWTSQGLLPITRSQISGWSR